jgi:hypothetical protein
MLSQVQVVAVRKAIELSYIGTCSVIERQKITKANKSTGFEEVTILENQPCRLSFERIASVSEGEAASKLTQVTKLLIAPEVEIKPGSKLVIEQNGLTSEYKRSGEPAIYNTHQEIILELFQGWA